MRKKMRRSEAGIDSWGRVHSGEVEGRSWGLKTGGGLFRRLRQRPGEERLAWGGLWEGRRYQPGEGRTG